MSQSAFAASREKITEALADADTSRRCDHLAAYVDEPGRCVVCLDCGQRLPPSLWIDMEAWRFPYTGPLKQV